MKKEIKNQLRKNIEKREKEYHSTNRRMKEFPSIYETDSDSVVKSKLATINANQKKHMAKKMGERRNEAKHFYAKEALEHRTYKKRMGMGSKGGMSKEQMKLAKEGNLGGFMKSYFK